MTKKGYLTLVALSAAILGGCMHTGGQAERPNVDVSSINETLEGTLGAASPTGDYTLQTATGPVLVHEGNATLAEYVGQNVRLTGQYSGTTLYVDAVEITP